MQIKHNFNINDLVKITTTAWSTVYDYVYHEGSIGIIINMNPDGYDRKECVVLLIDNHIDIFTCYFMEKL